MVKEVTFYTHDPTEIQNQIDQLERLGLSVRVLGLPNDHFTRSPSLATHKGTLYRGPEEVVKGVRLYTEGRI